MVCTSCSFELLQRSSSFFIGSIVFKDKEGVTVTRKNAIAAKTVATTLLADGLLTAGADGAVFLYVQLLKDHPQGPYSDMSQVIIKNEFPRAEGVPANVRAMEFSFTRVDRQTATGEVDVGWREGLGCKMECQLKQMHVFILS